MIENTFWIIIPIPSGMEMETSTSRFLTYIFNCLISIGIQYNMPHPIDRKKGDSKAANDLARAYNWHQELNSRLKKHGHVKEENLVDAIRKNKKYGYASERTLNLANDARKNANHARHGF